MSDIQTQIEMERLYNKNQTLDRLRGEFNQELIIKQAEHFGLPVPFVLDLLSQMELHKRAMPSVLIGILHRHFLEGHSTQEAMQICAEALLVADEAQFVKWDDFTGIFIVMIQVNQSVREELDQFQYPMPMMVPPKEVKHNRQNGYYSPEAGVGSILLNGAYHEYDTCLDHINRMNQIPLVINPDTVRLVNNSWRDLDHKKDDETEEKFRDRVKAFEKYDRISKEIIEGLFLTGEPFYMTHRYDRRGRCYAQGYHVNPQGTAWNKAVIEFANQELVQDQKVA